MKTAKERRERYESLKEEKAVEDSHCQEVAQYALPHKDQFTRKGTAGEKKGIDLYDGSTMHNVELLGGAMHSLLTNPAAPFLGYTTGDVKIDELDDVRKWLASIGQITHHALSISNFGTEVSEKYLEDIAFGTSDLEVMDGKETDLVFHARPICEVVIDENHEGMVDTVIRSFEWSARQIQKKFGQEVVKANRSLKKAMEKEPNKKFDILHTICPREDIGANIKGKSPKGYPVASYYDLKCDDYELEESGFHEMPSIVTRFSKSPGSKYGWSPAKKSLPDSKMANTMKYDTIRAGQLAMAPPMQLPDDGFVLPLDFTPFGVNFYRSGSSDRAEPLIQPQRLDFGIELMKQVLDQIDGHFWIKQLQLREGPQMTATEVERRVEQMIRFMGPMLGRQHSEFLRPLIKRVYGILVRKGRIPPAPAILKGRNLDVQYLSILAQAQKSQVVQKMVRWIEACSPMIQIDPTVTDIINKDAYCRIAARQLDLDVELINDERVVKKTRADRAEAQQKAAQDAQMAMRAEAAGKAAPAIAAAKEAGAA